ncbi:Uncharacterized protein SCF082_LOCUS23620 [Durusdinium trenchii]|uniref:Uncharacterized protein n=1 Tax=Durusdinium trenchii TaxID=1381693 RepID=A0ABP0LQS7_9DINO
MGARQTCCPAKEDQPKEDIVASRIEAEEVQHTHSSELGPVSSGESCEKYLNDLPPLVGRANSCSSSAAVSDAPMVAKVSSKYLILEEMRHLEVDFEITRGIQLQQALRKPGLWLWPSHYRNTDRSSALWQSMTTVRSFDIFLSHTWCTPGRWKILSLLMQFGWPHALTFWSIGVSVMAYLRWQLLVPGWGNYMLTSRGVTYECSHSPWIIISGWVSLVIGLMVSPYLPLRTTFCFFDIASIHQSDEDLKERGIYSIGGFLSVSNELRILWSRPYFSRLWCLFEIAAFRKANPRGQIVFKPLFVERAVAFLICMFFLFSLTDMVLSIYIEDDRELKNLWWELFAVFSPVFPLVHVARCNYREKARLLNDLKRFELDDVSCNSFFDTRFIHAAIDHWYGSKEAFRDFVRGPLREELRGTSRQLDPSYVMMSISSTAAWLVETSVALKHGGADGLSILSYALCWSSFALFWAWSLLTGIIYLSEKTSAPCTTRLVDWLLTCTVASAALAWTGVGVALCIVVSQAKTMWAPIGLFTCSMSLPCLGQWLGHSWPAAV